MQETFKRLNIRVNTLLEDTFYPSYFTDITMNFENFIILYLRKVMSLSMMLWSVFYLDTKDTQMTQNVRLTSQPTGIATDDVAILYPR